MQLVNRVYCVGGTENQSHSAPELHCAFPLSENAIGSLEFGGRLVLKLLSMLDRLRTSHLGGRLTEMLILLKFLQLGFCESKCKTCSFAASEASLRGPNELPSR